MERASDVHIEPMDDRLRIRNRVDGALHEVLSLPVDMGPALVSRIKVMANMNIVERRRPQDGQIEVTIEGVPLDVRVATTATVQGEKCVLRILDKRRALFKLSDLGMPPDMLGTYEQLVRSPYGMVICAGPTGSGKTTTLYATLSQINSDEINVMTVEDPVEYVFPTVNQIQINEQAGVTFAGGLRSILRQDPDAILVGEIRDVETARMAVQSALTGHLVLSSIHATDAVSALHRFLDMGIESFLIASSMLGVIGQRLVRRSCPECKVPYEPTPDEVAVWAKSGMEPKDSFLHGEGCVFCSQTGYQGRIGVYEVLKVTDEMKSLIVANASHDDLKELAIEQGMITLQDQALRLVERDVTTVAEILRTIYVL
jgi:type IV pilus assembly protein PilB